MTATPMLSLQTRRPNMPIAMLTVLAAAVWLGGPVTIPGALYLLLAIVLPVRTQAQVIGAIFVLAAAGLLTAAWTIQAVGACGLQLQLLLGIMYSGAVSVLLARSRSL